MEREGNVGGKRVEGEWRECFKDLSGNFVFKENFLYLPALYISQ